MTGKIVYRPHTCRDGRPDLYDHPLGTIWECECGNQFERKNSGGRVPRAGWYWINAPEETKKKRWWQS